MVQKLSCFRILYVFPQEVGKSTKNMPTGILRVSNFLNSKRKKLNNRLKEKYLDLRFESLPNYTPMNIKEYREKLQLLLMKVYNKFSFDLLAISCYTSFEYLSSVEIGSMVRNFIAPNCIIVVGGYHPTFYPDDFRFANIPKHFIDFYSRKEEIFNYVVQGEGEVPFFELVKSLTSNIPKPNGICVLKKKIVQNLEDLPLIDFGLFKKYSSKFDTIQIDFVRGCIFKCAMCINSTGKIPYYNRIRYKSIDKCIEELIQIRNIKWLNNKKIFISDPILFPKKSYRKEFLLKLNELKESRKGFNYKIIVYDHVLLCSKEYLSWYKKLDIVPSLGFESASISVLKNLEKMYWQNDDDFHHYVRKAEELIKYSSEIGLVIAIDLIIGSPSETEKTIEENKRFFLGKRLEGKSLIEKCNFNLYISKYKAYPFSKIYDDCERKYGGKIYHKEWWKRFFPNQKVFCRIVKPSKELDFVKCLILNYEWLKIYVSSAMKKSSNWYEKADLRYLREGFMKLYHVYKFGVNNYDSYIPKVYEEYFVFP